MQMGLLLGVVAFALGVVTWIVHLVRLSHTLDDVPDASIAISIVAIPVFLVLAGVFAYVVIGLLHASRDPDVLTADDEDGPTGRGESG